MTVPVVARAAATRTGATAGTRGAASRAGGAGRTTRAPRAPRPAPVTPAPEEQAAPQETPAAPASPPRSSRNRSGALTDQTGAPRWYRKTVDADAVSAANAGGGFALGVVVYVLVLTYLRGGGPEVKRLLRAKFLNKVDR